MFMGEEENVMEDRKYVKQRGESEHNKEKIKIAGKDMKQKRIKTQNKNKLDKFIIYSVYSQGPLYNFNPKRFLMQILLSDSLSALSLFSVC